MKTLTKYLIGWLGALVFCLLLLEAVLRIFDRPEPLGLENAIPNEVITQNSPLGPNLNPNSRGVSHRTGEPVVYRIGPLGTRISDLEVKPKAKDGKKIAFIGDSSTFGYGVSFEQSFVGHVAKAFPNVEVLNYGVPGFGVDQYVLRLKHEALLLKPSLIVLYLPHFGDQRHMHRYLWGHPKPFLIEDNGKFIEDLSHVEWGQKFRSFEERLHSFRDSTLVLGRLASGFYQLNYWYQTKLASTKYSKEETEEKACKILKWAEGLSKKQNTPLLIITSMRTLCSNVQWNWASKHFIPVSDPLITKLGENLKHLSINENQRFAEKLKPLIESSANF